MNVNYYDVIFEEDKNLKIKKEKKDEDLDSILGIKKASYKREYSVKHYEFDLDIYEDIYFVSNTMQKLVSKGKSILPVFDNLHKDIFLSLYKYQPLIYDEKNMESIYKINNKVIRKLVKSSEFKNLRKFCSLDEMNSATACEIIGKKALKAVEKFNDLENKKLENMKNPSNDNKKGEDKTLSQMISAMKEAFENKKELLDEKQKLEEIKKDTNKDIDSDLQNFSDSTEEEINNKIKNIDSDIENIEEDIDKFEQDIDDRLKESEKEINDLSKEMTEGFNDVEKQVKESMAYVKDWGLGDKPNKSSRIKFKDKIGALNRIRKSKKLKELSNIIGRFKESALRDQKRRYEEGAVSIKSVKRGNDIIHTLPSEKMLLSNKSTKKEFYRKYSEKQLLEYDLESDKLKSRGPMIVCIDMSSSMKGVKEKWSKAVAIALLEIAQKEKRNYGAILFNEEALDPIIIEKDKKDPEKILDIAERFDGGGTLFETPLNKALDVIRESKFKKADIVFITDGHSYTHPDFINKFNNLKDEKEFKVLSVLIYTSSKIGNIDSLSSFSDDIMTIEELAELESQDSKIIHRIFKSV
ncbi:VWA domain-containing protein [Clostridium oceanicum]|uniref:VWA domain-containing protein n=1 Tax=Clostridium oceanicum TaxID=1543 RepID=A0ABN1JXA3_9CLOT